MTTADGSAAGGGGGVVLLLLLLPVIMVNKSIQNTYEKFRIFMNTLACQSSKKNNSWIWKREKWNKEENGT